MLTAQENEAYTRVGPGTPGGELLRRYWWPVDFSQEVASRPRKVKLLGEEFVLFRTSPARTANQGQLGLLDLRCSHRLASLEFGRVEECGIRCCYHGWLYDVEGRCLEQPAEPEDSTFKDRIHHPAYLVQEVAGLVFAYIGPRPAPEMPRYDLLFRTDGMHTVRAIEQHYNWLQGAENQVDQPHLISLHASGYPHMALKYPTVTWERRGHGVRVSTSVEGMPEPRISWFFFPSSNWVTGNRVDRNYSVGIHRMFLQTPVDDDETLTFNVEFAPTPDGQHSIKTEGVRKTTVGVYPHVEDGWWGIESTSQDRIAQESQGAIYDRTREKLATSDRGITLFRGMLRDSLDAVQAGRDPIGVFRAPEKIVADARQEGVPVLEPVA